MAVSDFSEHARHLAEGLFPHQVEGVAFLLGRRRAILADDMGLGKTRQAIVAMSEMAPTGPYLVVCPASVKRNWAREIEAVKPDAKVALVGPDDPPASDWSGWVVVHYDVLKKHLNALVLFDWAGIVFDEAHYLKNHTSQRSKYGRQIVGAATDPVVYALTGTPMTNRPRDLFPLLQLANHAMGRSFLSFAKRYCDAYENGYGWVTDGASNLEDLTLQLRGVMLRRNKNEVLDLPPKLRSYLDVEIPEGTAQKETEQAFALLLQGRMAQHHGRESVSSRPGSNRGRLIAMLSTLRRKLATAKTKATIEFVQNALDQGEKVLVFSCFDEPLKKIHAHFGEASVLLTGATPTDKRQSLVDRFQNEEGVRVFTANIQAGGVGLNLTAARQVVFNDLDWVPANHWQAEDRAYRIGQTGAVHVSYMVAQDTIDAFVQMVLETKTALVDNVIEGQALDQVGGGDVLGALEGLMGALSPQLADAPKGTLSHDQIRDLLHQARETYRAQQGDVSAGEKSAPIIPEAAIEALIKVLSGPQKRFYRVASRSKSRTGTFYEIAVDGADMICSCAGFEYRGMCSHARDLKAALASGGPLPVGGTVVED